MSHDGTGIQLELGGDTFVAVMTGAGVSAESGLPTFRDSNGLWEGHRVEEVATPRGFREDPQLVWRFYSDRRKAALSCQPNAGHTAIAALEARLGDHFLLITQNVDGLHPRAGNERVVQLHGNLFTTKCSNKNCRVSFHDEDTYYGEVPTCPDCGCDLRPDIVWFGEQLDPHAIKTIDVFFARAKMLGTRFYYVAAGTSGMVMPAAGLVNQARHMGAQCVLANLEQTDHVSWFDEFVPGRSSETLPILLGGHKCQK